MQAGRYIEVSPRIKREIQEKFGVTQQAVSLALSFQRKGGLSKEIRDYALTLPEAVIMNYTPECEMIHATGRGWKQIFNNGWVFKVDEVGTSYIYDAEGRLHSQYPNITIPRLLKVLAFVEEQ